MADNNSVVKNKHNYNEKYSKLINDLKKLEDSIAQTIDMVKKCEQKADARQNPEKEQPKEQEQAPRAVYIASNDKPEKERPARKNDKRQKEPPKKEEPFRAKAIKVVQINDVSRRRFNDNNQKNKAGFENQDKDAAPRQFKPKEKPKSDSGFAKPFIQPSTRVRTKVDKANPSRYEDKSQTAKNSKTNKNAKNQWGINGDDDTPVRIKSKKRNQAANEQKHEVSNEVSKVIMTAERITVKDLSEKIGKSVAEIVKKLFMLGIMATINQEIDYDTAALVCSDFGIELELQLAKSFEEVLTEVADEVDDQSKLVSRPPVVTIMGHVDHGKTSLLDAIRDSNVTEGEAGGITQHIGAYQVSCNGRPITFIDTPGHEAFTSMRARGAQVTDIVILVVAADDGIMPQTIEAINHSKAAGVPIIVAVNKIDKEGANPERVKMQLTEYDLVVEDYGGDVICVPISAKKRQNIDGLLEMVLLQADILDLKANPDRPAKGTIVEAELHKGKGPVATVLVQNGTLKVGDSIVAGTAYGKVRAMMDDKGRRVTKAGPSTPVQVQGFNEVPAGGDILNVAELDKLSRQVAEERRDKQKAQQVKALSKISLNDLFSQIAEGNVKELNIIVKADVQGSVEAVKQSLEKLSTPEVKVKCIHGGVGAITSNDIMFATASNAIVIGFNVRPDAAAKAAAEKENVDMRLYRVIYQAIEDVEKAMQGLFDPEYKEVELGRISVRNTFKVSGVGTIAGAYVQDGKVTRSAQVRIVRDGIVIHEGKISSLKRFKDDAREVLSGYECGIGIENFNDIQENDIIEAYVIEEIKRG